MKASEVIAADRLADVDGSRVIGIDIGSRQAKAVLIDGDEIHTAITASGVHQQETANRLLKKLAKTANINVHDLDFIVGTGYGRIALDFDDIRSDVITEISCHAMGAHFLNSKTKTIIDIGGQDCKAIKVDPDNGRVVEFVMNDKCAAGTGRFLEKVAELLDFKLDQMGLHALQSGRKLSISSQCVVFAESEVISLKAKGERREDIAAAIHFASARRVRTLVNRLGLEPNLVFSGGVSNNQCMRHALEEMTGHRFADAKLDMVYAGALGAAIYAQRYNRGTRL